ncbi:hypothetical protein BOTCAL_0084g00230 [Botryotinia calthae]|uniref:Uncharacterized protein n=1 Tax=Botryotinia calthae TaxID=38488 RepID=A0A4Y8DA57_9HELO|nr:hypothetical protein BOTCAL_0084g00230 [Botryotinia calthae]
MSEPLEGVMHLTQFSLLVFATGTGLCNASLLRRSPQPAPISTASTTLQTVTPSPTSPTQSEVTTPPGLKLAQIAGILTILPECNRYILSSSSAVSSNGASNVSDQLIFLSTAAAASISIAQASISIAQASISAADASASSAIAEVQSSASAALASANSEIISAQASASSQLAAVSASLISAAALATNSAQAAALAIGAAATESAWAISSQLADATTAVQFSKATTLPMTVAVVLILGTSFATGVVSVLVYRFIFRRRMKREKESENEMRDAQNRNGNGYYGGGGMEKGPRNYTAPHPGTSYNYPATQHSSVSTSYPNEKYISRYTPQPEEEVVNRDYVEGNYERGDEDNYSTHDVIDIEKEIAEMNYQMKMAEAELGRRDRERSFRASESGLSRSSKSISVLFTPRDLPQKAGERRGSGARSIMSMGIGERLKSIMPSYRQSQASSSYESKEFSKDSIRDSTREMTERDLEEGEEIIFTLDERPPPLPKSNPAAVTRPKHAYTNSDTSIMTLRPSVYDGGESKSSKRGKGKGVFSPSIGKAY